MYQNFIIPYLYEAQHVSDDTPPIIGSLKLHWQPLVFHTWKVVGCVVGGRCQAHCASCWIFLYELYYGARIHEHQTCVTLLVHYSENFLGYDVTFLFEAIKCSYGFQQITTLNLSRNSD